MKSRRIRTLSTNIATGTVSKRAPVPAPAPPAKTKRTFEVQTDEEQPNNVVEVQQAQYDKKKLIKSFEDFNSEYFNLVLEQVLRHQALRTAISQVGNVTNKEFNTGFVVLDTEIDEALSEIFKLNFLTSIVDNLNERFHPDEPLNNIQVAQMLFFPQTSPAKTNKSDGFDSKKLIEQLGKLIKRDPAGPYGLNSHDKAKS